MYDGNMEKFNKIKKQKNVYVIAEACLNHNGNYCLAKMLVDLAKDTGCDAVKFQTFNRSKKLPYDNLSYGDTYRIKKYCDTRDITFFSTPYTYRAVDFLQTIVPFYKIASAQIVDDGFVEHIKNKHLPIIASVGSKKNPDGLATLSEIDHFLSLVDTSRLILLYCVSKYPHDGFEKDKFMELQRRYPDIPWGFSCHSKDIKYSLEAVDCGACIVEQHITLDDNIVCPDQHVSLNPDRLQKLVNNIRGKQK